MSEIHQPSRAAYADQPTFNAHIYNKNTTKTGNPDLNIHQLLQLEGILVEGGEGDSLG
jgi:hypothetical protein